MKKTLIIVLCFIFISCFKEPKKDDETSRKVDSPRENIPTETNKNNIIKEHASEIENHNQSKYEYIKKFKDKYPSEVNLFSDGVLNTQLINLLGKEKYYLFKENMSTQTPIEINDEYAFASGGAPHSFSFDEACIEIDFVNNIISVGIMTEGNEVFYYTEKEDKNTEHTNGMLNDWLKENIEITVLYWQNYSKRNKSLENINN